MQRAKASDFTHTSAARAPLDPVAIVLTDELDGTTGIYHRDADGGLWPCRTVSRDDPAHHADVVEAWRSRAMPEPCEDRRRPLMCA